MKTLILGGNSGIGEAVKSALIASTDDYRGIHSPTKDELDVGSWESVYHYINYEPDGEGFDRVVYSAGVNYLDWIGDISLTEMIEIYRVNVLGFINLLNMLKMVHPETPVNVVAIASDAATRPLRTSIAYCSSKAALTMAIRCAARELAPMGWRVNGVAPGVTEGTPMTEYLDRRIPELRGWSTAAAHDYEQGQCPMGRRATVQEVARVVLDVLNGPEYLNGEIVTINGGR